MKLKFIKKFPLEGIMGVITARAFKENHCVFLCVDEEKKYKLLHIAPSESTNIDLPYDEKSHAVESKPVLFALRQYFGIVKSADELLLFSDISAPPQIINIQNRQILPSRIRLCYQSPVNDDSAMPICFEKNIFCGDARDMAFLQVDTQNFTANWQSQAAIDGSSLANHKYPEYAPKIDSVLLKSDEMYVFTSGGQTTSVPKWGMDYYACVKCDLNGAVVKTLLDSGDLHADGKKRGANGIFSSSQKYLLLTPVFSSDEYKGKQRIFSLDACELSEIFPPRRLGKNAKLIDHHGDLFWFYIKENQEIAICCLG